MSQHGRDNNNNMKYQSPEPIALGSGLFFVFKLLIYRFLLVILILEYSYSQRKVISLHQVLLILIFLACLLCLGRQRLQKIYTSSTVAFLRYFNYMFGIILSNKKGYLH
ncbi:MAG TPA: hypothetical protein DCR60_03145 [Psychrobacter sp.]|nr:hypothetical protein [Psychrobacter sp.]